MGKNKSASNLVNVIDFNNDRIAFLSGSTTLMSISSSGAITTTGVISGSNAASASYALNAGLLNNKNSDEFTSTGSFNSYTSSNDSTVTGVAMSAATALAAIATLASKTGSYTLTSSFNSYTASNNTTMSCVSSTATSAIVGVGALASKTGSYATTGSNTFAEGAYFSSSYNPTGFSTTASLYTDGGLRVTKDAYISGTLYLNNVTVYGTQSVAYITSSQLNIASNLITVNTATPSVRFGGLAVYDSGSSGLTGSMLWDSQNNSWIYSNPSGSGNYDSAMVIMGPRNSSTLGSEVGLTCNYLVQGHGHHHTTSSMIFHDGTTTCFPGNVCASSVVLAAGGTINNLANIQYSGYTWASYNTGTGAIILQNATAGGININAGVACFASNICAAGHVSSEDVRIYRSAGTTTGYINFGSTGTNYFGFDGTKYVANGALAGTNGLFSGCIGIGATTVGAQLHIEKGGSDIDIKFTDVGVGSYMMGLRDGCARFEIASGNCLGTNTALSIDTSGRVGIGTTAGTYSLNVAGRGYFFATNQDAGWGMLTLDYGNGDNSNIYAIQFKEGNAVNATIGYGSYSASSCGDIIMWTNDGGGLVERMRMYPTGRTAFYVDESSSNTNGFSVVGRTCNKAVYLGANCTYVSIQSHGSVPLRINELGNDVVMGLSANVGIGTASTSDKLHVLGVDNGITICSAAANRPVLKFINGTTTMLKLSANGVYGAIADNSGNDTLFFKSGQLGIGCSTPGAPLTIRCDSSSGAAYMELATCTSNAYRYVSINAGSGIAYCIPSGTSQSPYIEVQGGSQAATGGSFRIRTGALGSVSDKLTILQSGEAQFACNACFGQKTVTSNTAHFYGGSTYLYQQFIGGNNFTAGAGGDYIHIKTNVTKDDRMVGFNVRGYMYSPNLVDSDIGFYTYSPVSYVYGVTVYNRSYTGWQYCLYYSSDSKVVLVVQGSSTYGGFILSGINTARYNNMGEMCVLGITQTNTWSAQY